MSEHKIPEDLKTLAAICAEHMQCDLPPEIAGISAEEVYPLIERIARVEAERDMLRMNHPFGAMYDGLQKSQAENATLRNCAEVQKEMIEQAGQENATLRAALERRTGPVTDEDRKVFIDAWDKAKGPMTHDVKALWDTAFNALLAQRAARKEK